MLNESFWFVEISLSFHTLKSSLTPDTPAVQDYSETLLLVLMKVLDCNLSIWETKTERSWVSGQPWLFSTLQALRARQLSETVSKNKPNNKQNTSWKYISVVESCLVCTKLWVQYPVLQMKTESPMISYSSTIRSEYTPPQ